jgi:uncharacterized protein YukE
MVRPASVVRDLSFPAKVVRMHAEDVASAGSFAVTPGRLRELAAEVAAIHGHLDRTRAVAADVSSAFGSDLVATAFQHFVTGWRDGRRQIAQEVDALSRMLEQAAQVYKDTDASLATAIPVGPS